ncbi:hypothetical protein [Thermococcus sp. AM4]|uniref:hypothetical protein n=1 Tax=Thermococcus sp. (strain AM4) TaxID=246969 RepID=UPI000187043B|nr:hypothetical protein [Thermococcus sp. AM4]EEB74969.1 hypothetical protein TAM4_914 [Thermococcus sp. AM4]
MESGIKLLKRRLDVVKKQKEYLILEEAKLVRMARQKKKVAHKLERVKREKFRILAEEAKLLRVIKQSAKPA